VLWDGERASSTQALAWPRADIMEGTVPPSIKIALYETAYLMIGSDITAEPSTSGLSKIEVGPIKLETTPNSPPPGLPRFVRDLVSPYGQARGGGISNVKLTRS
jgi:hypothetical protein